MTVRHLAHGRDVCDRILLACGLNPDLMSTHEKIEIELAARESVKYKLSDDDGMRPLLTSSVYAFNDLIEFCKIPNQANCTWIKLIIERDCLVTLELSSHLELKDE